MNLLKILILGGLGFIGSYLTESLVKKHHNVKIITKTMTKINHINNIKNKVTIEKFSISNQKKLSEVMRKFKPDVIVHLAGNTSHSKSFDNPLKDINTNAKSTLFILEKIRAMNLNCKFILGSTFVVVGKPLKLPVNEETSCNPTTIYGVNKLSSESFCKIYQQVYGLKTNIFRITNSYGPREQIISKKNAVNFLINQAFIGKKIQIYNKGDYYRDFIYIDDVISGINTIIYKGKPGELYWIASGKKILFKKFAQILSSITKCPIEFPDTPEYIKKVDVGNFVVNNSKLKKLGWKSRVTLEDGIKKTLESFKEN